MANVICQICLSTDIKPKPIGFDLICFLEEICDYENKQNARYKVCSCCFHLLRKFYNFKQRCLKACQILNSLKNMKNKPFPTDLYEQMPPIGFSNSVPPHKVLTSSDEGKHNNDISINTDTNPNNRSKHDILNIEFTPHDTFKEEVEDGFDLKSNQLDEDNILLKTILNKTQDKVNVSETKEVNPAEELVQLTNDVQIKQSTNEHIQYFDDNKDVTVIDASDIKIENDDPLQDDCSTNSLENEHDLDTDEKTYEIVEKDNQKDDFREKDEKNKLKYLKELSKPIVIDKLNLEEAELFLKDNKKNKKLKARVKYLRKKDELKTMIIESFESDNYDLGDDGVLSKEAFLKIFDRCEKPYRYLNKMYLNKHTLDQEKVRELLQYLLKRFNPEYETVFNIEYLDTEEKKLQEFNNRKDSDRYKSAPFKCELCYTGFHIEKLLIHHLKNHVVGPGDTACHICSLKILKKTVHYHDAVYSCKLCPLVTYYKTTMMNHFAQHKGVKHQCKICLSEFENKQTLYNHARTHATHACAFCGGAYVSAAGLTMHAALKHKNAVLDPKESVTCSECNTAFASQAVLKKHMIYGHKPREFRCHCKEVFSSMDELKQHKIENGHAKSTFKGINGFHSGFREWVQRGKPKKPPKIDEADNICAICNETVPASNGLMYRHYLRAHPGERYRPRLRTSYLCDVCGRGFLIQGHLRDHQNVHTGARPYKCSKCPAAFATSIRHKLHAERHRPARHACTHCGKMFKSAANLYVHKRIHIGDRRFKCHICTKGFLHSATLTEHINGVHFNIRKTKKERSNR